MKKLLITGGSGFVGTFVTELAAPGYEVYSLYSQHVPGHRKATLIQVNFTNPDQLHQVLARVRPDIILHTAAISKPDACEADRDRTVQVNIQATVSLADWARANGARMIFTSSDLVFDGRRGHYSEDDATNPISFYGETKARAEQLLSAMDFNCALVRLALVYGIGQLHQENFFHQMVNQLRAGKSVNLFYDQFRTPISGITLAEALLELAESDFTGILHVGGSERISRWDFGLKACAILNLPTDTLQRTSMFDFPSAASRPQDVSMNTTLAQRVLRTKLLDCTEGLQRVKSALP
ncbi:MAG: SDR family oxidoreductase [Candidatus Zhuqueibacterota bacterium]